jgi:Lon-like ATP-dependent protease
LEASVFREVLRLNYLSGISGFLSFVQIFFAIVIGLYFFNLLRAQQGNKVAVERESRREMDKLQQLRKLSLTEPLAEKTRPSSFEEIVGQQEGLKVLRAALCGPNPQHVIMYGPPGVGKTAAARLILEEARKNPGTPFGEKAKFIEIDATTARFDERGIADPLIGSVHDPIYQGAGPLGMAGIPQPKPGAVTKAHGGVLFIDEIGELHPVQMNKLLKVLEDRKVFLESAYYSSDDVNIPIHIHDIFQNGLPADFRLVGATTRLPENIPRAIRSRCMEVYFKALQPPEIELIAEKAAYKINVAIEDDAIEVLKKYSSNGREAVNIIQLAAGIIMAEQRAKVSMCDIEWVINSGQYSPRPEKEVPKAPQIGYVSGLAVYGPNMGTIIEIEAVVIKAAVGKGKLVVTGIIDEEEIGSGNKVIKRKSMARGSVENVLTVLRHNLGFETANFDIHVNFPGGIPIDGPSAGIAVATAIYSAAKGKPVDNTVAMTGEVSIKGTVKAVGGIVAKIEAARQAGAQKVIIPKENYQASFKDWSGIDVIAVDNLANVIDIALVPEGNSLRKAAYPVGV